MTTLRGTRPDGGRRPARQRRWSALAVVVTALLAVSFIRLVLQ